MAVIAVIPARYASTRFPGKPLACKTGKPLIQHVWERVRAVTSIDRVIVATDDRRIVEAVSSFGGEAMMTRDDHPTGTDRVGEIVGTLRLGDDDIVLNVQGDEPEIDPRAIERLIERMRAADNSCRIATLACPFDDAGPRQGPRSPEDPNCVKVVLDSHQRAMYFSRSLIPYPRSEDGRIDQPSDWLLHLGVYAFRADVIARITGPRSDGLTSMAATESLEQLRWLGAGHAIAVAVVDPQMPGIDTPDDYKSYVARMSRPLSRQGS